MVKTRATTVRGISHFEVGVIAVLLLLGAALRYWRISDLGLIHFDEGVYAISGMWTIIPYHEPLLYAKQILFSPPLFFSLVSASYWLTGHASDQTAILVSVMAGILSIPLVWWISREWFGKEAGIAAASLMAFSNYHIAYSRMALTDVTFSLLYLASLASIAWTFKRGSYRLAILSGIAVGATWNTKYHGWLLLLVALSAWMAFSVFTRQNKSALKRYLICWIVMTSVAVALYLPWALYVQSQPGGYFSLMKYQRGFLSLDWTSNIWIQMKAQLYMDGWLSRNSPGIAVILALLIGGRPLLGFTGIMLMIFLFGLSLIFGGIGATLGLSFFGVYYLKNRDFHLSWLLLATLGLFSILIGLYQPYPRLMMPWIIAVYITGGAGVATILSYLKSNRIYFKIKFNKWFTLALFILFLGTLLVSFKIGLRPPPRTWMSTDSVRNAAESIAGLLPNEGTILIHGAPEVVFYLRLQGLRAIPIDFPIDHPKVADLYNSVDDKLFLITGIYGERRDPLSQRSLERLRNTRIYQIEIFPIKPNDVRLLNDFRPDDALQYRHQPTNEYDLHLYRIAPEASPSAKP